MYVILKQCISIMCLEYYVMFIMNYYSIMFIIVSLPYHLWLPRNNYFNIFSWFFCCLVPHTQVRHGYMAYTQIVCVYCSSGSLRTFFFGAISHHEKSWRPHTVALCGQATIERPCVGVQGCNFSWGPSSYLVLIVRYINKDASRWFLLPVHESSPAIEPFQLGTPDIVEQRRVIPALLFPIPDPQNPCA